jgi:hypothetical protein
MPRRSRTELLGLVDIIIQMYYQQGKRHKDIAEELTKKGYRVSKGAVQRALKSHSKQLRELKEKQDWAKVLTEATNKTPRLEIADAALQITAMKLLEEVSEIDNFKDMDADEKIVLLTKVTRAIGLASNVELNYERGRKAGWLEAEKKLDEKAAALGISDEAMSVIRAEVFGLKK